MAQFTVIVNDGEGHHFRRYNKDTLQMLYDVSPSAANFEMIIVIEGLVFMAIRSYYIVSKNEKGYGQFINKKKTATFYHAIEFLYKLGIIENNLKKELHEYRELRNEIAHDLFQFKSVFTEKAPTFKNVSHTESLEKLFDKGLEIFILLGTIITPGHPSQVEYLKRFSGYYKRS